MTRLAVKLASLILGPSGLEITICLCLWTHINEINAVIGAVLLDDRQKLGIYVDCLFLQFLSHRGRTRDPSFSADFH